jgi:hypothetical protein
MARDAGVAGLDGEGRKGERRWGGQAEQQERQTYAGGRSRKTPGAVECEPRHGVT